MVRIGVAHTIRAVSLDLVEILVTGGTGHTGSRLVRRLRADGHIVRVLTREPVKLPLEIRRQLTICRGDIRDAAEMDDAVAGVDAVVAMTHIKYASYVISAMQRTGVRRVVFTSSTRRFTRFPEETARQVIAGEQTVRDSGLDWTIIRASMIYGDNLDNNITHLVRILRLCPVHPLIGGGRMLWQPVFTWDVVDAITSALQRPVSIGRDYTVAGLEPVSYADMVRIILRGLGKRRILVPVNMKLARGLVGFYGKFTSSPRVRLDQIDRLQEDKVFDISEAQRDLGFHPIGFEEGIRRKLAREV